MIHEDNSVTEKLLPQSNNKMDKATIENEKDTSLEQDEGDLRLHDAVYDPDNIDEIETLVSEEPNLVFERDRDGRTPLITLANAGDEQAVEIAKILVGAVDGEDDSVERPEVLNLQDSTNSIALHYASKGRQPELVSALLRWGSDAEIKDANGNTPAHLVAEGNTEKALEVMKILLTHDTKKVLTNTMNNNEFTPLHVAISKKAVKMVKFLLRPEFRCNLSVQNKRGQTPLHFACSEIDESSSSCEIVREILKRCTKTQINLPDLKMQNCLHAATIKRFPQIVRILLADDSMEVVAVDELNRTALHYATEDGCYTKGWKCVDALIEREFVKYDERVNYLFKMEDKFNSTAYMYACLNCPAETMKKYVSLCPQPKFWYMTLLYKNSPLALKALMDKAFTEVEIDPKEGEDTKEGEDAIQTDFGIITGYTDPVDILPQQETKYLKEAAWWDYETQREILLHPLAQFFILKKWHKLKWIILSWILWQLIWLAAYSAMALSFYTKNLESNLIAVLGSVVMLIYLVGSLVNEAFEMYTVGSAYILSLTNIMQLIQNAFGLIAIFPVLVGHEEPYNWMKYTTAAGILLAYVMSMRDIGKLHSEIGLIVEVLKQVLILIVQVLFSCSPLWLGFTIAFMIIFDDEESLHSSFPGPIVKVLVMMTGEFEYNDTFKDEEGGRTGGETAIRFTRLLFFLAFLISVPVGFFNLLTGFALDKVMELRERAKVARIAKQLEHIYFIESILLSFRPLRKIFPHKRVVSFLRRLNVTSAWLTSRRDTGPELKFETLLKEKIRKSPRNLRKAGFRGKLAWGKKLSFSSSELPTDVREEIYRLASPLSTSTTSKD